MWSSIFVALTIFYGVFAGNDETCLLKAEEDCRASYVPALEHPREFPSNRRELREDCLNLYKVKECIADTLRNCREEADNEIDNVLDIYEGPEDQNGESNTVKDMTRIINVMTQICDEKSELHRNLIPYLHCLRTAMETEFEQQTCRDYTTKAIEFLRSRIENKARVQSGNEEKYREVRTQLMDCLRVLFDMNCFIIKSKKECDYGVKQPLLEIMGKGGSLYYQCPASIRIDVIELLDALKLVTKRKIYVRKLIQHNSIF